MAHNVFVDDVSDVITTNQRIIPSDLMKAIRLEDVVPFVGGEVAGVFLDEIEGNAGRNQQRKKLSHRHDLRLQPKKHIEQCIKHRNWGSGVAIWAGHKPIVEFGSGDRHTVGIELVNDVRDGDFLFAQAPHNDAH